MAEVENSSVLAADESFAPSEGVPDDLYQTGNVTVGTRRQANGTIGSVYSGNKIKHLKKEDGIPLWRKDIQHQFLKLVFEDRTKVFTRQSDKQTNMDFADIYMDAMARSSKTSKILKDKLQNDKPAALSMAMVCLLVNFGRMNTTLNCMSFSCLMFASLFWREREKLTAFIKSFRKCVPSYEPITPSRRYKPTKIPTPISNCRMHRVSSPSSKARQRTSISPILWKRLRRSLSHEPTP